MKVLFIASGNDVNGVGAVVRNQAQSMIDNGTHIDVFPIKGKGYLGYFLNIPVLRKYLKSRKYDIIHAHYSNCLIISYLSNNSVRLGVSFMGTDVLLRETITQRLVFHISRKIAKERCNFVIVKTNQMAEVLKIGNEEVVPNGVDLNQFYIIDKRVARERLNIDQDKKAIIFVSNPDRKEKNYSLARQVLNRLTSRRNDIIFKVVFNINSDELLYYYNAADLLILTSFHEGSVNVVKEAMACNCPIVSTDVGDVGELIRDTKGCFLTSFDELDVTEKVEKALQFNGRTNGRDTLILRKMDSDSVAVRIEKIYKKALL